ncbi:MAG: potassium uptake protein, TrkH family [Oscillospiraceae bacterium]|nr:potassium uptake protein, TrkH family [Oscillospiraceae bacterium]
MNRFSQLWYQMFGGKRSRHLSATRVIALVFLGLILTGTVLLMLPAAARSGESCGFLPALFTATSATCVTGLTFFDTWSQFSGFGQIVIISLIQIGGLGFMSVATLVVFLLRRKVGLKERLVMAQALSLNDMDGVVRLQKWVIFGSLSIEGCGALILTLRFLPEYGFWQALKWGVFHSISAFCNAGFDIFGSITPGASLMEFQSDPVVLLTLGSLVVLGGLGFLVWQDVVTNIRFRKFSVYTRLVLVMTGTLLVLGTVAFALTEWNNPNSIGHLNWADKLLNCFFQSVTTRTAGFFSFDQAGMTDAGKAIGIALMLVGGSSGSTAGGAKTVTVLVLVLFLMARARGKSCVCVFRRTVPMAQVLDAMTILAIMVGLSFFGAVFISITSPVGFLDAFYESASALATVGISAGATGVLSIPAQILIIIFMYFGRVGILTISLGFLMGDKAEERFRYAHTNLLIG